MVVTHGAGSIGFGGKQDPFNNTPGKLKSPCIAECSPGPQDTAGALLILPGLARAFDLIWVQHSSEVTGGQESLQWDRDRTGKLGQ